MIVAIELPLNVATIMLGCIFTMLFSDFRVRGPISTPTPPIEALTEFFPDKRPSIADIVVFNIFAKRFARTSEFIYIYIHTHAYIYIYI